MSATSPFETERLVVRDWEPADVDRALDLYSRWEVARWLGAVPMPMETRQQAVALVTRWSEFNASEEVGGRWAVQRKDTAEVAGTILLVPLPDGDGEYEVGWHLHPDSWGNGFATEAAQGAVARGFEHGLEEILAVVRPSNAASLAVCRRLGMEALGQTDRYYETDLELFRLTA